MTMVTLIFTCYHVFIPRKTVRGGSRGWVQGVRDNWYSAKKKKTTMWFIGVEVEQETSVPPPKKIPGSAPGQWFFILYLHSYSNTMLERMQKSWPISNKKA